MSINRTVLAFLFAFGADMTCPVFAQVAYPPAGGPNWQSIGPPQGNIQDFLGDWKMTWDGPMGTSCPCHGTLSIEMKTTADGTGLAGYWETKIGTFVMKGAVGVDQNVWVGSFAKPNDNSDFPVSGNFRLAAVGGNQLAGSYKRDGMTIPFRLTGTR